MNLKRTTNRPAVYLRLFGGLIYLDIFLVNRLIVFILHQKWVHPNTHQRLPGDIRYQPGH